MPQKQKPRLDFHRTGASFVFKKLLTYRMEQVRTRRALRAEPGPRGTGGESYLLPKQVVFPFLLERR
jgi:hypothetical protein